MKPFFNETLNFLFRKFWVSFPKFWILPKLYELCKCCRRNPTHTVGQDPKIRGIRTF